MTQAQLADRIEMGRVGLSRRMQGHQAFTIDELYRISDALGVSVLSMFPEDEARETA